VIARNSSPSSTVPAAKPLITLRELDKRAGMTPPSPGIARRWADRLASSERKIPNRKGVLTSLSQRTLMAWIAGHGSELRTFEDLAAESGETSGAHAVLMSFNPERIQAVLGEVPGDGASKMASSKGVTGFDSLLRDLVGLYRKSMVGKDGARAGLMVWREMRDQLVLLSATHPLIAMDVEDAERKAHVERLEALKRRREDKLPPSTAAEEELDSGEADDRFESSALGVEDKYGD